MEDFAELFAKYINQDVYIELEQIQAIEDIIDYYKSSTFTPEYLAWSQKPVWEKEFQTLLKKFEKSNEKLKTVEGSFNKCLGTCESFYERMSEKTGVSILRAEGYKSDLIHAHPKWQKFKSKEFMVHYVLCHDDKVIDLTAKQFNTHANFPLIQSIEDFSKNWISVEFFKSKSKKTSKLKI